jgi:hypothetical protein
MPGPHLKLRSCRPSEIPQIEAVRRGRGGRTPAMDSAAAMPLLFQEARMTGPLSRAKRYKERAAECMRLAGQSTDQEIARHYQSVAENYLVLAQGELALAASQEAARKQLDS